MNRQRKLGFAAPNALITGILTIVALALGARTIAMQPPQTAGADPSRTRSVPCDYVLLPQYDCGGCASPTNPVCSDGGGGGADCCRHFHLAMGWNTAFRWVKPTGLTRGPSIRRYYMAHDDLCSGSTCSLGTPAMDPLHYQTEDTLVSCAQ